jgi:uncharacterized protein YecE (DUF72 family)
MMGTEISIRIGTSGWTYKHWESVFYPDDWPKAKWLEYYARHFDTVELNASFYKLPSLTTFKNWKERTPDNFLWSVKASKFITHIKRLKDPAEQLKRLYDSIAGLEGKLGVILFQLPPSLHFDEKLIRDFCELLDRRLHYTLETRHSSWLQDKASGVLNEFSIAHCLSDTAGRYPSPEEPTADFVYIRLHGSEKLYASGYTEEELKTWAEKIRRWKRPAFVYFDNDFEGHAVKNAMRLKEIFLTFSARNPGLVC